MSGALLTGPTGSSLEPGDPSWRRQPGLQDNWSLPRLNGRGHEDQVRGPCLPSVTCESQPSAEVLLCPQVTAQGGWNSSGKSDETPDWFTGTCLRVSYEAVAPITKPQILARESSASSLASTGQILKGAQWIASPQSSFARVMY